VIFSAVPKASLRQVSGRSGADAYISKARGAEHRSAELVDLCRQIVSS
jgi:hypothetical protein